MLRPSFLLCLSWICGDSDVGRYKAPLQDRSGMEQEISRKHALRLGKSEDISNTVFI